MDLSFSEEQDMLREAMVGVCADFASIESVREHENEAKGYSDEFWAQLTGLGITGLMIPEEYGGSGMTMVDSVVVYEELGRSLAPSPHFVSSVVSAGAIVRGGSKAQKADWLAAISSGEMIVTPAWLEPDCGFGNDGINTTATADGDGFRLNGAKRHVFFASSATKLLVLAKGTDGEVGGYLVDPNADGVTLTQQQSIASDAQYRVDLANVAVVPGDALIAGFEASWYGSMLEASILAGAQAIGGAEAAHDLSNEYAKVREQFGKPLGAFQSINHYLADGITDIAGARILVHQAAAAHDARRPISELGPMAKLFATKVFRETTATAIQIFGGLGFTVEYDAQLYFRRAKSLQMNWWDKRYLEDLIAAEILD